MTVCVVLLHTKVGVLLLYLVFEAVVGLYMERCTLLETAGVVRGRRKRGRGGRKEVVEQACGRPTACVSALQQQEEAEVVEAELLRRLFARHVETPILFPCLLLV